MISPNPRQFICNSIKFAIFNLLAFSGINATVSSQEIVDNHKVVVLFGSSFLNPFRQNLSSGFFDAQGNLEFSYEFLQLDDYETDIRPDALISLLKDRQEANSAELVISVTSPVDEFLFTYGDEIYGNIPRIFLLPSPETVANLESLNRTEDRLIFSSFPAAIEETMSAIFNMLPGTERIYLIAGLAESDLGFLQVAETTLRNSAPSLQSASFVGLPLDELEAEVRNLPDGSVIFLLPHNEDQNGIRRSELDVIRAIRESTNSPIFSNLESVFTEGIVGGAITDVRLLGRITAETAANMIAGTIGGNQTSERNIIYEFDQIQLSRWSIDSALLPPGSIVVNQQPSYLETYGELLLIFFVVTAALLVFMLILNRRKQEFQTLWEATSDAMITLNAEGSISSVNSKAEEMFGYLQDELLNNSIEMLVPERKMASYKSFRNNIEKASNTKATGEGMNLSAVRKSGEDFPIEISLTPIVRRGNSEILAEIRDVSKRKAIEEALLQSQKLDSLGRLAGGVAHDLNNILSAILGFTELSRLSIPPQHKSLKDLDQVSKAGDRAKKLVSKILSFSRQQVLEPQILDINSVLQDIEQMLRQFLTENINMRVELEGDVKKISVDPVALEQIIVNLVVNSVDAMPDGGKLTISTRNRVLDSSFFIDSETDQGGLFVELSVSDTGTGISPELQKKIFDPFFSTKPSAKGTGLGLASLHGLVKQSNGRVIVFSEEGVGTTFNIYFPVSATQDISHEETTTDFTATKEEGLILLVEDDKYVRDLTQRLLESIGYSVLVCESAESALEMAPSLEKIDLLLTDIVLPGISGLEMARELEEIFPSLKVLFMSGFAGEAPEFLVQIQNKDHFLQKPFSRKLLFQKVAKLMT